MYVNGRCLCHRNMIFKGLDCSHLAAFFTSNVSRSKLLPTECCEGPILLIAFCSLWTNAACMHKTAIKLELWGAYPVTFYIFVFTDVIWKWASVLNFLWPSGGCWNAEAGSDGGELAGFQPSLRMGWCRRSSTLVKVVSECKALLPLHCCGICRASFLFSPYCLFCSLPRGGDVLAEQIPSSRREGDSSANSTLPSCVKRSGVEWWSLKSGLWWGRRLHAPGPGEECMEGASQEKMMLPVVSRVGAVCQCISQPWPEHETLDGEDIQLYESKSEGQWSEHVLLSQLSLVSQSKSFLVILFTFQGCERILKDFCISFFLSHCHKVMSKVFFFKFLSLSCG